MVYGVNLFILFIVAISSPYQSYGAALFSPQFFQNDLLLSPIRSYKLVSDDIFKLVENFKFALEDNVRRHVHSIKRYGRKHRLRSTTDEFESPSDEDELFFDQTTDHNEIALEMLLDLLKSKAGWEVVSENSGILVERRYLKAGSFVDPIDAAKSLKHACVKSTAILNTSADAIFDLFMDTAKTKEYNSHCVHVEDVYVLSKHNKKTHQWSKISYARGPRMGPFKARDFCSVVQYIRYPNGTSIILNRPAYYSKLTPTNKYVRATVLLAGNIIEPLGDDKTRLTVIAHINPGGGADTKAAAYFINQLCAVGPPNFLKKVEACAKQQRGGR